MRISTSHLNLSLWGKEIDGGMTIMHGFSTVVNAKSIGKNYLVSQQVTIGWGKGEEPVIGDNVKVSEGAIIVGGITIGDNAVIGAGAVVFRQTH